jgi:hypothetical protein
MSPFVQRGDIIIFYGDGLLGFQVNMKTFWRRLSKEHFVLVWFQIVQKRLFKKKILIPHDTCTMYKILIHMIPVLCTKFSVTWYLYYVQNSQSHDTCTMYKFLSHMIPVLCKKFSFTWYLYYVQISQSHDTWTNFKVRAGKP